MTATVTVTTQRVDGVLTLPTSAVSARGSNAVVHVLPAGAKAPVSKAVTIGQRGDSNVEITSGLSEGDKVITTRAVSTGSTGAGTTPRLGGPGGAVFVGGGGGGFGGGRGG
jgi:macrolide-specific efflux system membrane fusion protein